MNKIEELRYLIKAADAEGEQTYRKKLSVCNITPTQNEILKILSNQKPLSINQIGDQLICGSDHPSRLIQRMIDKELLSKEEDRSDYRKTLISITDEGKKMLEKTREIEEKFNHELEQMIDSDEVIMIFIKILTDQIKGTKASQKLEKRKKEETVLEESH